MTKKRFSELRRQAAKLRPREYLWIDENFFFRGSATSGPRIGISYVDPEGFRVRRIVGDNMTIARAALAKAQTEIVQGKYKIKSKRRSPSFEAFADRYMEHAEATKASWRTDDFLLRKLRPHLEGLTLSEVTSWRVEQYKAARRGEVSARTVNAELSLLRRMFNLAIAWGFADANPVTRVKWLREDERVMRVLSPGEETKLLDAAPRHLADMIVCALHTGMRRGEILGLEWEHVDAEGSTVTVAHSKSGRVRVIPTGKTLAAVLTARRKDFPGDRVFTYYGRPIKGFYRAWNTAVAHAKIRPIRFHDLRHTFATRLVLDGYDIVTVQELLGHASIEMTRRYSHTSMERKRAAIEGLDND